MCAQPPTIAIVLAIFKLWGYRFLNILSTYQLLAVPNTAVFKQCCKARKVTCIGIKTAIRFFNPFFGSVQTPVGIGMCPKGIPKITSHQIRNGFARSCCQYQRQQLCTSALINKTFSWRGFNRKRFHYPNNVSRDVGTWRDGK